jgi:hypothetical protein
MTRTCMDCPTPISRDSKGRCKACAMREVHARPELRAARDAKIRATRQTPEFKARHQAATAAGKKRSMEQPGMLEKLQQMGRDVGARNFWRNGDAATQAAGRLAIKRAHLDWCPEEYWDLNDKMKAGGMLLAERKAVILAEVEGTPENASRAVANHLDAQRIRHERDVASRY